MAKVNVASELCQAFRDAYTAQHANHRHGWLPMMLGATKPAIAKVVERWIKLCGAESKAA